MNLSNIIIADDEKPLANFLIRGLKAEGYGCVSIQNLHELLPYLRNNPAQILILDRMFGSDDSIDVLPAIKQLPEAPMVLMLSALEEVSDRVKGLTAGADDYLCKPFDFEELLARIVALERLYDKARSADKTIDDTLTFANLKVKSSERIVELFDEELRLTKLEFDLLFYLVESQGKVVTRERILSRVWHTNTDPLTNIVDVYISRLRKKLAKDTSICIETLIGNGYRLKLL